MATPSLHWLSASGEEQIYPITTDETIIGRKGDADIVFSNPNISRHHVKVMRTNAGITVVDLGSLHGTLVNGEKIEKERPLKDGDRLELGKDRVEVYFFTGAGRMDSKQRADTTEVFQNSLANLGKLLPSSFSDLEKISCVLDFQYQWEQTYTPDAAFLQILESALKISGAERAFVLLRQGEAFEYAAGIGGKGRTMSLSEFQASHSVIADVGATGKPVFMVEGIQGRFAEQASIVAMNLRAIACLPLKGRTQEGEPTILGILYLDSRKTMHSLSGLDERILTKLAVDAGTVIERIEMIKGFEQRRKLEAELALAEETQRSLLPQNLPNIEGFRLRAFSKPTRYVGGDFYDFIAADESAFTGVLADVSGKGVAASLLSSMTLGCLEMQLRAGLGASESLNRINKFLCERSATSRFVTMFVFTLDCSGVGTMVNAGHNPVYVYRSATRDIEEIGSNCMIVGALAFANYETAPLKLERGDVMVVYSDGLTEAENPAGEMLGEQLVKEIICRDASLGAEALEHSLLEAIHNFTRGRSQTDDITLMIVEKT